MSQGTLRWSRGAKVEQQHGLFSPLLGTNKQTPSPQMAAACLYVMVLPKREETDRRPGFEAFSPLGDPVSLLSDICWHG